MLRFFYDQLSALRCDITLLFYSVQYEYLHKSYRGGCVFFPKKNKKYNTYAAEWD